MSKTYFSTATFRFLRALSRNNNRTWFHAHSADYERHVREPFLQFIADLQAPLAKISSHYRADPRKVGGSLFRIHRDTRFASDKTPYKHWAGARFFHERRREVEAPSFYLHIQRATASPAAASGIRNRKRSNACAISSSTIPPHGPAPRAANRSANISISGARA